MAFLPSKPMAIGLRPHRWSNLTPMWVEVFDFQYNVLWKDGLSERMCFVELRACLHSAEQKLVEE